jgi:hypothetical protein
MHQRWQQRHTCSNKDQIVAAAKACQSETNCATYSACVENIPDCTGGGSGGMSGTGTGGTSGTSTGGRSGAGTGGTSATGTGGRSGTGGAGGASGTACADLLTCCNATTNATYKSLCMSSYTSVMAMGNSVCADALEAVKSTFCP